jgi:pimeloyl-ACP methyl ester carboxylesterase
MHGTVVMIHGMWCGSWTWDRYVSFLEQRGWRCLRPVLRYHDVDPAAQPDPRLGRVSLLDYAADLEAFVRGLGEPPVLLGHSMGGLLALMLAARGLGRAAALLTPSSPAGVNALTGSVIRSFLGVLLRPSFWKTPMRLGFPAAGYAMLGTLPPEEQRATYARLVHESGRAATEMGFWQLDRRHATRIDPSCIRCPILIVSASDDRLTPASVVGKTASLLGPRAVLREFPGHGHWVVGEPGWQEIATFVADWLERRTRGQP